MTSIHERKCLFCHCNEISCTARPIGVYIVPLESPRQGCDVVESCTQCQPTNQKVWYFKEFLTFEIIGNRKKSQNSKKIETLNANHKSYFSPN